MVTQPYLTNLSLLVDYDIRFYKIRDAVIEILFNEKIIDRKVYYFLKNNTEEIKRNYSENVLKEPNIQALVYNIIKDSNSKFLAVNNIQLPDVLEIDASNIIVKNRLAKVTRIGYLEYILEDQFSNFININSIRIYSMVDILGTKIKIKGIDQYQVHKHFDFMINAITQALNTLNTSGPLPALQFVRQLYNDYISYKLPVEYYRAFNLSSSFVIIYGNSRYEIFDATEDDKLSLDISYNKNIIQQLFSLLVQLSFKTI